MYLAHFGLKEPPFGLTPDTDFFFAGASYREALNTLRVAALGGEGFIKVVGEVGNGKTLLCRQFLGELEQLAAGGVGFVTAYLPNPYLEPRSLLLALATDLGVGLDEQATQHTLVQRLTEALLKFAAEEKRVVVCLDEAQAMPLETLEVLRLLTNLETGKRKLLQVVLFGQPELDAHLSQHSVRQLLQRITFQCRLGGLRREELADYLAHRLSAAGYEGAPVFSGRAEARLYRVTQGTPRLVNIVAHKAMLLAYGQGSRTVSARQIMIAADDTPQTLRGWGRWWPSDWIRRASV
jgi:MSHA biogenesis protein MshM